MTDTVPAFGLGRLPRITFGPGVFTQVPAIVARHGTRVLLVTGGHSFNESPRRAELEAGLAEAGPGMDLDFLIEQALSHQKIIAHLECIKHGETA